MLNLELIYVAVNCVGYHPMFLGEQLHYAESSLAEIYETNISFDTKEITSKIERLLLDCRASREGNVVHIYITPDGKYTLRYVQSTIYRGYAHSGVKATATLEQYELPVEGHRTAISLATAEYMKRLAARFGVHVTIRVNSYDEIVSVGDYPIAIAENSKVILPLGAPFCFEAELLDRLCRIAGVEIRIEPVSVKRFLSSDGAFLFGVSGIQSVASCRGVLFSHSMASHLERFLPQLQ